MSTNNYTLYVHISPSNKLYFGITKLNVLRRWYTDGSGYKHQRLFWRAIQKYGWNNFKHIVILENISKEWACELEIALISKFKSNNPKYGYNIYEGGTTGNQHIGLSDRQREQIRNRMLGRHLSEQTKLKISKALKGRKQTVEHIENARRQKIGKKFTASHIEKLRLSHIGYRPTEMQKYRQSESLKRYMKTLTDEERKLKYGHIPHNKKCVHLYKNNEFVQTFTSSRECAEFLKISPSLVCMMLKGTRHYKDYTIFNTFKK